jgi:hypothetical protein
MVVHKIHSWCPFKSHHHSKLIEESLCEPTMLADDVADHLFWEEELGDDRGPGKTKWFESAAIVVGFDASVAIEDLVGDFYCFACVFGGADDSHGTEFNSLNGLVNIHLTARLILDPINHPSVLPNQELNHALRNKNNRLQLVLFIVLLTILVLKSGQLFQQILGAFFLL